MIRVVTDYVTNDTGNDTNDTGNNSRTDDIAGRQRARRRSVHRRHYRSHAGNNCYAGNNNIGYAGNNIIS